MAEQTGSSPMFAIFVLSLLSLALIPYTIYHLTSQGEAGDVVKPWQTKGKRRAPITERLQQCLTRSNVILVCLWIVWGLILLYTQYSAVDMKPFDPYEILNLQPGASPADIKRQYRKLAMEFHPDKNPDPAASKYFAEYVTKAHTALTDETARKNYEKYGHPDGPQALDIGIALPEWIFSKDRNTAPLVLGGLVGLGILLPLGVAAWYLLRSNKLVGPNNVMAETMDIYFKSKYKVKESQGLSKIPDTLVVAMEFIIMPTPNEQSVALEELRKTVLRLHPDLKDKKHVFWKDRKTSVMKVHMLLLAYLGREEIPDILQKDLKFLLEKSPLLLEEMVKIAQVPRHPQQAYGWYEPSRAAIQMCQCIVQAMSVENRKSIRATKSPADNVIPLLQLPNFDQDLLVKINRRKVKTLQDLLTLSASERSELYKFGGLSATQADEAETSLMAMPTVHMSAKCMVDGEDSSEDIMESDIVTCAARVVLTRHSHLAPGFSPGSIKGNGVQAYAPNYLGTKMEKWTFILCDPNQNQVWSVQPAALVEAERKGAELAQSLAQDNSLCNNGALTDATNHSNRKANGHKETEARSPPVLLNPKALTLIQQYVEGEQPKPEFSGNNGAAGNGSSQSLVSATASQDESEGQLVEIKFRAVRAGRYSLQLQCMSDSWVGCDISIPVNFKISEMSKADREGQTHRGKPLPLSDDEERSEGEDEDDEDEEGGEYDSEESGTEESGADDDNGDAASDGSDED